MTLRVLDLLEVDLTSSKYLSLAHEILEESDGWTTIPAIVTVPGQYVAAALSERVFILNWRSSKRMSVVSVSLWRIYATWSSLIPSYFPIQCRNSYEFADISLNCCCCGRPGQPATIAPLSGTNYSPPNGTSATGCSWSVFYSSCARACRQWRLMCFG